MISVKLDEQAKQAAMATLILALEEAGVSEVRLEFYGGGDNGDVDEAEFYYPEGLAEEHHAAIADTRITVPLPIFEYQGPFSKAATTSKAETDTLENMTTRIAEEYYITASGVDWYNGEGGRGEWVIDVKNGTLTFNVIQFEERYDDEVIENDDYDNVEPEIVEHVIHHEHFYLEPVFGDAIRMLKAERILAAASSSESESESEPEQAQSDAPGL